MMKVLGAISALLYLVSLASSRTADPVEKLSEANIKSLTDMAESLQDFQAYKENVTNSPITDLPVGRACLFNSHCGLNEECIDMLRLSSLVAEKFNSSSELQRLNSKARITGKECSKATPAFLKNIDIEEILKLLEKDIERINKIMDENDLRSVGVDLRQISGTFDINVRQTLGAPMTRQFGLTGSNLYGGSNNLGLIAALALRDGSGLNDNNNLLLLLLASSLYSGSGGGPYGGGFLQNPFLFYPLLNNNNGLQNADLLTYSFLLSPGGFGGLPGPGGPLPGPGPDGKVLPPPHVSPISPLILYSILNNNGGGTNDNNLLLLSLFSGGHGGPLGGGPGLGGLSSYLPLLLFSNGTLGGNNNNNDNNLLLLSLLSHGGLGGIGGGPGFPGSGIESLLPLLLAGNNGGNLFGGSNSDLLLLLSLSGSTGLGGPGKPGDPGLGGLGGGILPLLLLSNSSLFGGSGSGNDNSLLYFLLASGGGLGFGGPQGPGGHGFHGNNILPLLLLDNSLTGNTGNTGNSGGLDNNLLLLLAATGGIGGIGGIGGPGHSSFNSLLPILALRNSGQQDTSSLIAILLASQAYGGAGFGPGPGPVGGPLPPAGPVPPAGPGPLPPAGPAGPGFDGFVGNVVG